MVDPNKPNWLKSKGYLHITRQIDVDRDANRIIKKIQDKKFVARYAFYPLLHTVIKERRYKRISPGSPERAHALKDENGKIQRNIKERPLHYASHMDALIFGYYAHFLQSKYEEQLQKTSGLTDCIIAYRKLPSDIEGKHKSTIHFAHEIFEEIKRQAAENDECVVLTFDIKSFFSSLNHEFLKRSWADLIGESKLPADHYNVFKAATRFSYIYLDELRVQKRGGFDEKERARIRNNFGINALFESPESFRRQVKDGTIKLHKYPFWDKESKIPQGIPQGLPISALLANLYLYSFDVKILNAVVDTYKAYYRRYSDDIIIVCKKNDADFIEAFVVAGIEESKVQISKSKTEKFLFRKVQLGNTAPRLSSIKICQERQIIGAPLSYLGFEFNGQRPLIKSSNLSKFYRRMISSVKSKAKRAKKLSNQIPEQNLAVYRRQLFRLYTTRPLSNNKVRGRVKKLEKNRFGSYTLTSIEKTRVLRSNYLSYVDRASEIMQEPAIKNQIRKHRKIFNDAIRRYLS